MTPEVDITVVDVYNTTYEFESKQYYRCLLRFKQNCNIKQTITSLDIFNDIYNGLLIEEPVNKGWINYNVDWLIIDNSIVIPKSKIRSFLIEVINMLKEKTLIN